MEEKAHQMYLEKTNPSGAEEWCCPICGRRLLMKWSPLHEIIVLEAGDPRASHNGVKGFLQGEIPSLTDGATQSHDVSEESLRPWIQAIENLDLNW